MLLHLFTLFANRPFPVDLDFLFNVDEVGSTDVSCVDRES